MQIEVRIERSTCHLEKLLPLWKIAVFFFLRLTQLSVLIVVGEEKKECVWFNGMILTGENFRFELPNLLASIILCSGLRADVELHVRTAFLDHSRSKLRVLKDFCWKKTGSVLSVVPCRVHLQLSLVFLFLSLNHLLVNGRLTESARRPSPSGLPLHIVHRPRS